MADTRITLTKCYLRPLVRSDAEAIQREADNPKVAYNMLNGFPSPYTLSDAQGWIELQSNPSIGKHFAIIKNDGSDTLVGMIGYKPQPDVWYRTAEIGYWMGEAHWGQGLTTDAVKGFTKWVFENATVVGGKNKEKGEEEVVLKICAHVFGGNDASMKVLEKAGYKYEGKRRKHGWKDGKAFDVIDLGILREDAVVA